MSAAAEAPTTSVPLFIVMVGLTVLLAGGLESLGRGSLRRNRATRTLPVIVGFAVGCGLGAACVAAVGLWSLVLPTGLALLVFAVGFAAEPDGRGP